MVIRACLYLMAFGMMMTAAAIPPYFQGSIWASVPETFRWAIGASQMLYLLAGMIVGAISLSPRARTARRLFYNRI